MGSELVGSALAGADLGGDRVGICRGTVVVGVSFYFWPPGGAIADRLALIAPICGRFGDDPSAPLTWARDDGSLAFQITDVLLGDPPPLAEGQVYGELLCPTNLVVAGARGTMDFVSPTYSVRDITLECAPPGELAGTSQVAIDRNAATVIAANVLLPFQGAEAYAIGCDGGNAATGLFVSSGSWFDGFYMLCAPLRRPRLAGDACSDGDACQSGVCDAAGLCASTLQ